MHFCSYCWHHDPQYRDPQPNGLAYTSKVLIARSVLELPPIITHQGHPFTFFHPCLRVSLPTTAEANASSDSNLHSSSGASILLELRCSFQTSSSTSDGKPRKQQPRAGNALMVAPRACSPRSAPKVQQGGVLCIQV